MANTSNDHPIVIAPNPRRVRVFWRSHLIADTTHALSLAETSYPAVNYIPREDVVIAHLVRSTHQTRCPYKGVASYYSLTVGDDVAENAVWTYDTPIPGVAAIAGYLAFYSNIVESTESAA
jgi:uncharacterized protein (DUF427 family)